MHIGGERREFGVESIAGSGQLALAQYGDGPSTQPLGQLQRVPSRAFYNIGQRNIVAAQQAGDRRFDERRREPGKDRRGAPQDALIKYL